MKEEISWHVRHMRELETRNSHWNRVQNWDVVCAACAADGKPKPCEYDRLEDFCSEGGKAPSSAKKPFQLSRGDEARFSGKLASAESHAGACEPLQAVSL